MKIPIFADSNKSKPTICESLGLLTKGEGKDIYGNSYYFLDNKRLTHEQYMALINNCPDSKYYYDKGCKQRKIGRILLIAAGGCVVAGPSIGAFTDHESVENGVIWGAHWGTIIGAFPAIASIPFFISGKNKKNNAYKVYNEYCSQPKTTLSFGPTGKGVGVSLNF